LSPIKISDASTPIYKDELMENDNERKNENIEAVENIENKNEIARDSLNEIEN